MEQLRWLPDELGSRYVFINQPAFMVYYHNNNKEELSMRVVVGRQDAPDLLLRRPDPDRRVQSVLGRSAVDHHQRDAAEAARRSELSRPHGLSGRGERTRRSRRPASTGTARPRVDRVRQPPSGDNALGELKILFPNSHAIYMHDTPSKSFFKKDMRALSHGCVRLADPRAMAAAVLKTSVADVAKQIATGQNKAVQVPAEGSGLHRLFHRMAEQGRRRAISSTMSTSATPTRRRRSK